MAPKIWWGKIKSVLRDDLLFLNLQVLINEKELLPLKEATSRIYLKYSGIEPLIDAVLVS
eukprot:gene36954-45587_t